MGLGYDYEDLSFTRVRARLKPGLTRDRTAVHNGRHGAVLAACAWHRAHRARPLRPRTSSSDAQGRQAWRIVLCSEIALDMRYAGERTSSRAGGRL